MEENRKNLLEFLSYHDKKHLVKLEQRILQYYEDADHYDRYSFLLKARKNFIDGIVLEHQDVLLADIIAFNEALRLALQKMYDHAHLVWAKIKNDSLFGSSKELVARCFLPSQYPALHPVHRKNSEALYGALQDTGWNKFYEDGVSFMPLRLAEGMEAETFDAYIGMDCPPPNWNEGLDQELTKDLHLILQFNHLFEYTNFALTDFIYCRDFESQTEITLG